MRDFLFLKKWVSTEWANPFKNPIGQNSDRIADVHSVQQTGSVKELLKKHKTSLVNVPAGCRFCVPVVKALINKLFKDEVRSFFEDHLDKNLDQYVDDKINASQQRVLMTKWVGEAWYKVEKMKDSIICFFKKCGL